MILLYWKHLNQNRYFLTKINADIYETDYADIIPDDAQPTTYYSNIVVNGKILMRKFFNLELAIKTIETIIKGSCNCKILTNEEASKLLLLK